MEQFSHTSSLQSFVRLGVLRTHYSKVRIPVIGTARTLAFHMQVTKYTHRLEGYQLVMPPFFPSEQKETA